MSRNQLEALALVIALAGLQAVLIFLGSQRALRLFSPAEPVADLTSLAPELAGEGSGTGFRLDERSSASSTARLAGFRPDTERRYAIRVRAAGGLSFEIQMIDRAAERATRTWRVPMRPQAEERWIAIEPWALAPANRIEVRNRSDYPLEVLGFAIFEIGAWHARLWETVRPVALALLVAFFIRHRQWLAGYLGSRQSLGARDRRTADRLLAGLVFLVCFHLYLAAPVQQRNDVRYNTAVTYRLITEGTLTLSEDFAPARRRPLRYQFQEVDGRVYHFFPDAVAVLNAPFVAAFSWFGVRPVGANGMFLDHNEHQILVFAAAFLAALLCALLFFLARIHLRPGPSVALTALFAFGTQIFSTVSRSYWSHAWALVLLTGGLCLLLAPGPDRRRLAYVAAATFFSWSFFCRPPMALAVIGVTLWFFFTGRRHRAAFLLTGLLWALLFAAYSLASFHQPLPPYFLSGQVEAGIVGVELLKEGYAQRLLLTLFAASRGLFVYVPFLAVVLFLVVRLWRDLPRKDLALTSLGVVIAHWNLLAAYGQWWGGNSYGPRLFADVLPWFFVLAALVWGPWTARLRTIPLRWALTEAVVATLLAALALFINSRGAHSRATAAWDRPSMTEWRHAQFLAGLSPEPRVPSLAERLSEFRTGADESRRGQLLEAILQDPSLPKRTVQAQRLIASFVTWDNWTHGDSTAALLALNDGRHDFVPRLRLATWAGAEVYPITVRIHDGESLREHVLTQPGVSRIELSPVASRSRRLYAVWSDKAWSPGEDDPRTLGVQLLGPE